MKRLSLATLAVFTIPLVAPACNRSDDDLPPPIPVAVVAPGAAPQPQSPSRVARAKDAAPTPVEGPQGGGPGPGPAQPASTTIPANVPASTPFQIPWFPVPTSLPASFPTSLPQIPGLPAIPAMPGLPGQPTAPPQQPTTPPQQPTTPPQQPTAPPPNQEPQGVAHVTVYGTKWCGPCKRLQSDLSGRGVPYEFVDVEDSKAGQTPSGQRANEIPAGMRGSVPVTRVKQRNGQVVWVKGADADGVERAYRS